MKNGLLKVALFFFGFAWLFCMYDAKYIDGLMNVGMIWLTLGLMEENK